MKNNNHTFVICAYKEEKNLEFCVQSLKNQTCKSKIIISTSTPNSFIENIAKKYDVELSINSSKSSHVKDFYYAYDLANTKYVTLCHQDDVYYPEFGEMTIKKLEKSKKPIIAFTNYNELRNGVTCKRNLLLIVKRIINFPLLIFKKSKFIRKLTLSFGNAICCPSVTYNKEIIDKPFIECELANADWISYIEFAKKNGEFIYIKKPLMAHRIHENSTTTKIIRNDVKRKEDYEIFKSMWPTPVAKLLLKLYSKSEKLNNLKKKDGKKMKFLLVVVYLLFTISGLILYKYGTTKTFDIQFSNKIFSLNMSLYSVVGLICYLLSFLLYMIVLPRFDISYLMPMTSGISYISIMILSALVLKESITIYGYIGASIILIGVLIMNIKK